MPLQQAIDTARLHGEKCGTISMEQSAALETFGKQELADLASAYPDIHYWAGHNMFFGGVHAVSKTAAGIFAGKGDPRRDGVTIRIVA